MKEDFRLGPWTVRPASGELARGTEHRRAGPKPMQLLVLLATQGGRVVSKEEVVERVWEGAFTSDEALSAVIYELRKLLDDDARSPTFVETLRGRGFRLLVPAEPLPESLLPEKPRPAAPPPEELLAPPAEPRSRSWRLAAAFALLASLGVAAAWYLGPAGPRGPSRAGERPPLETLAVLPLTAITADSSPDPLTQGLTELLTADLALLCPLEISPAIAVRSPDGPWDLPRVEAELGVDAVVEGTVLRSGDRLWVTVQLVETESGRLLWSGSYDREVGDELGALRDLAVEISAEVREALAEPEP